MSSMSNNSDNRGSLINALIYWLLSGAVFWLFDALVITGDLGQRVSFLSFRALKITPLLGPLAIDILVYSGVFIALGIFSEVIYRLLVKLIKLPDPSVWHAALSYTFILTLVGTADLQSVIFISVMTGKDVIWQVILILFAVAAFILIVKYSKRVTSWTIPRMLIPLSILSFWLLPLFFYINKHLELLKSPAGYLIYMFIGILLSTRYYFREAAGERNYGIPGAVRYAILTLSALIFAAVYLSICWSSSKIALPETRAPRKNIIMIVMDTVRADHMSCYGYSRNTSPFMDRLAAQGVLFENVMSASSWTVPSHASMFTGMFPGEHMATGLNTFMDMSYPTLAEILTSLGYQTVSFSANPLVSPSFGLVRGFEDYHIIGQKKILPLKPSTWKIYFNAVAFRVEALRGLLDKPQFLAATYPAPVVIDNVLNWLSESYDPQKPFFIFINLMDAHIPYPPHPNRDRYMPDEATYRKALEVNTHVVPYMAGAVKMTEEDFDLLLGIYDSEIRAIDDNLLPLAATLRDMGKWDDALVFITSDHGEYFGERNLMGHSASHGYATLNIPLIVLNLPGYEPGARVSSLVQNVDYLPTIMDVLHVRLPWRDKLSGKSLLKTEPGRKGYADCYPDLGFQTSIKKISEEAAKKFHRQTSIVWHERFEYIWSTNGERALYYLPGDPREANDISEVYPERASRMSREAERRAKRSPGVPAKRIEVMLSPEERQRLKALGYIGD